MLFDLTFVLIFYKVTGHVKSIFLQTGNMMTTPMAYNLPTQDSMSMIEEKDDSMIVEQSLMGSIDTK